MATAEIIVEERRPVRRITPAARHAEILALRSEPVSPAVAGRIRRALALLAAVGVLIQPMSLLAGPFLTNKVFEGTDAYTQWQRYAAAPAPDVLFLGPSEARTDVDTARLSNLLTRATGHRVTVGKLGFSGSEVHAAFLAGRIEEIRRYCETDVLNTYLLYLRFQQMRGRLSADEYAAEILLARDKLATSKEPHWREFLTAWDANTQT